MSAYSTFVCFTELSVIVNVKLHWLVATIDLMANEWRVLSPFKHRQATYK